MAGTTATPIERDIVIVRGADAGSYLQSQFTQDILSLGVKESAWSFLLTPKSEIVALFRVTRTDENEYTLDMDVGWGDAVRQTIDEFLFRMDVSFEQAVWPGLAWRGDVSDRPTGRIRAPAVGGGGLGIDEIGPDVAVPDDVGTIGPELLDQSRIETGWPGMGAEIDGSVTPVMTGLIAETVSFDKGCYTGQEFVARVHYRDAEPPKRLIRLTFDADAEVAPGESIIVGEDEAGYVTSAAQGAALGYLKRGYDTPSGGEVAGVAVQLLATEPR